MKIEEAAELEKRVCEFNAWQGRRLELLKLRGAFNVGNRLAPRRIRELHFDFHGGNIYIVQGEDARTRIAFLTVGFTNDALREAQDDFIKRIQDACDSLAEKMEAL